MHNYNRFSSSVSIYPEVSPSSSEDNNSVIIDDDLIDNTDTESIGSDDESESDDESDDGIEYDSIHNEDSLHFYSEKEHGKYYIGLYHLYLRQNTIQLLMSTSVSARSFFRHSYDNINNYLYYYGLIRIPRHHLQIMQVDRLPDETCTVIIKTYWLRLIQRHWRQTYIKRMTMIRNRISPNVQYYKQTHGCYPLHMSRLPGLMGMLSGYAHIKQCNYI